ncbi:class I SAM-dependent methyltransferase [Planotetraspora sp. A-T 1434]|uniref:class I SAM-dependent methyltransferase n=1 Tax=Planotetraspora sp. A-T 1434 TaxID=2979219 RepID=UPI0021C072B7|nr:class I SAM-dependent methyltransferase [Planotetraspora sp. A-T 1434]MCT9931593.1 class I SAM-dependent methyltransferase [Planotetraspora sp. A-T 1434]
MSEVQWSSVDEDDVFSQRIREQWTDQLGRRLDILIAGCGRGGVLDVGRCDPKITGIDEDLPPLRAYTTTRKDLDAWYLDDMRSVPIPPRSFDVIYVAFLLERIRHAELVLDRIVAGLRPGGLLLIKTRDGKSAYGFCDRVTPPWLRRTLWKSLVPAGSVGPLPAVYEPLASREGIQAYCLMRGLMIAEDHSGTSGPARRGPQAGLVNLICRAIALLSRGRLTMEDEVTMVIRKPHNHFARLI